MRQDPSWQTLILCVTATILLLILWFIPWLHLSNLSLVTLLCNWVCLLLLVHPLLQNVELCKLSFQLIFVLLGIVSSQVPSIGWIGLDLLSKLVVVLGPIIVLRLLGLRILLGGWNWIYLLGCILALKLSSLEFSWRIGKIVCYISWFRDLRDIFLFVWIPIVSIIQMRKHTWLIFPLWWPSLFSSNISLV